MSVEQAIHEHWGCYKPLTDLVPEHRVFTGNAKGEPQFPYVTLERQGDAAIQRTSSGTVLETVMMRFSVWAETLDAAKTVATEILDHFNRADFAWSRGRILDCRLTNQNEIQEDDGIWHLLLDYQVRASHTSGT